MGGPPRARGAPPEQVEPPPVMLGGCLRTLGGIKSTAGAAPAEGLGFVLWAALLPSLQVGLGVN